MNSSQFLGVAVLLKFYLQWQRINWSYLNELKGGEGSCAKARVIFTVLFVNFIYHAPSFPSYSIFKQFSEGDKCLQTVSSSRCVFILSKTADWINNWRAYDSHQVLWFDDAVLPVFVCGLWRVIYMCFQDRDVSPPCSIGWKEKKEENLSFQLSHQILVAL